MTPVLIGYFPKKTVRRPDWLKAANVEEVCSASDCISDGPANWISAWKHNGHWVYTLQNWQPRLSRKTKVHSKCMRLAGLRLTRSSARYSQCDYGHCIHDTATGEGWSLPHSLFLIAAE
jgi:hypothetical protein